MSTAMNTSINDQPLRVRDVVCGMMIDPATAAATSEYQGQTLYFCAPLCKRRFDTAPERYISA